MNFQRHSDALLASTLLPFIPRSVTPNQVSWVRVAALPFIFYFLATESYLIGFTVFTIAALTDALDGAMARTRDQITETGKVLDAVADRGLIFLVAFIFVPKFFGLPLLFTILALESVNGIMGAIARRRIGMNPGANWAGKIKMIIQCIAFGMIFVVLFSDSRVLLPIAEVLLWVSVGITLLQSFLYPRTAEEARGR